MPINRKVYDQGMQQIYGVGGTGGGGSPVVLAQTITTDTNFSGTTRDITISSVTTANCAINVTPNRNSSGADRDLVLASLTSSTNLRLKKGSSSTGNSTTLVIQVIEFDPNVITSIQTASFAGTATGDTEDITITSVDTGKSIVFCNGISTNEGTSAWTLGWAWLTSSTNCRIHVRSATAGYTIDCAATIVEF